MGFQITSHHVDRAKKPRQQKHIPKHSPVIVGTYDGVCSSSAFSALPNTPKVAGAYEYGILDGNLGQMVSFQSTYKSTFRIEVPVWPDVQQGVLATKKAMSSPDSPGILHCSLSRKKHPNGNVRSGHPRRDA